MTEVLASLVYRVPMTEKLSHNFDVQLKEYSGEKYEYLGMHNICVQLNPPIS